MTPKIIAHRGASNHARENTIEAFDKAIEIGADMIEFDIRRCRDGVFVIHHDETVDGRPLGALSHRELLQLAPHVPRLEDVLALTRGRIQLDVELKEKGYEDRVLEHLLRDYREEDLVVTTFNDSSIARIKKRHPSLRVGLILGKKEPEPLIRTRISELFPQARARRVHADFLVPHWKLLRFGFLSRAAAHRPVWVWTVNDEKKIAALLRDRRIACLITDKPDIAMRLRSSL